MKAINVALALIVSFALAFGVAELGLRLVGFGPPAINTQFDSQLGWVKEPGSVIRHKSPKAEFDVTIRTDALGLRDDYGSAEIPAKPEGTTRMLMLGDSFVLGYTVEREDLFVDILEKAWAKEGRNIEVINAGTQAYSTDQALVWLQENGAKFDPDVVALFPYENDIWWNAQPKYLGSSKPYFDETGALASGELEELRGRGWFGSTAVGNLLRKKHRLGRYEVDGVELNVEQSSRLVGPTDGTPFDQSRVAEARTAMLLGKMNDAAAALGARFVVCPIPSREAVMPPAKETPASIDHSRPYQVLADAARAAGPAGTVLPLAALKAAAANGWSPYYKRDFHLNPAGNLVLAEALKSSLEAQDWFPRATESATVETLLPEGSSPPPGPTKPIPKWPFWFLGLVGGLGTLFARTYPDEKAPVAYLKVGALLAVVFATALGVGALMGVLPPMAGKLLLAALVIALLTFVLYKLGDRVGTILELLKAFTLRGHWYLMPLLVVLLTVGSLLVVAASSPLIAPFIYTLF